MKLTLFPLLLPEGRTAFPPYHKRNKEECFAPKWVAHVMDLFWHRMAEVCACEEITLRQKISALRVMSWISVGTIIAEVCACGEITLRQKISALRVNY